MADARSMGMQFLCEINPAAGHDEKVLAFVKKVFGDDANITILEEQSDIYVLCPADEGVLDKHLKVLAYEGVLDARIDIIRPRYSADKEVRADAVYLVLIDSGTNDVGKIMDGLRAETDKVGAGNVDLLLVGEYFGAGPDVFAMIAASSVRAWTLTQRIRAIPGVVDTQVFTLRRTE